MCVYTPQVTCMEIQGQLARVSLWILEIELKLCTKHTYPTNHLATPTFTFLLRQKRRAEEWEEGKREQELLTTPSERLQLQRAQWQNAYVVRARPLL